MRRYRWKGAAAQGRKIAALSLVLTMVFSVSSLAAEKPEDMDDETWTKLQDNTLEYGEIDNLVGVYNSTIQMMKDSVQENLDTLDEVESEMYWGIVNLNDLADEMEDMGKDLPVNIYEPIAEGYRQAADGYEKAASDLRKQEENLEKSLNRTVIRPVQKQLTSGVKSMVIGYHQMRVQKEMLEKLVELYGAMANSSQTQTALGMGTELSAATAAAELTSAQNSLASLNAQMAALKSNICRMTGWSYDGNPEILPVPASNPDFIASINLEEDKQTAIGNNYTLIQMRNESAKEKSTVYINAKLRKDAEGDQKVSITIESLYQELKEKELQLQAAETAFKKAELQMQSAGRMFEMGMMGQTEYLSAQVGYYQQKAARDAADMNFLQTQENYYYAVNGLAKLAGE